jgi:hypothetical protein
MMVSRAVEVGEWAKRDEAAVELVALDRLRIRATLPQADYARVSRGARAEVSFDALPGRTTFRARSSPASPAATSARAPSRCSSTSEPGPAARARHVPMFKFAIERPVILTVAVLILTLFGVLSIFNVPVQMIPDLDARIVTVSTKWPGRRRRTSRRRSSSSRRSTWAASRAWSGWSPPRSTGSADIELEFPFSVPMEEALLNVNNALSQVPGYPENVDQPSIKAEAFSSNAFMYFRLMPESGAFTEEEIVALRDWVEEYVVQPDGAGARGLQRRHARRRRAAAAGVCGPGEARRARHPAHGAARRHPRPQPGRLRRRPRQRQAPLPAAHHRPLRQPRGAGGPGHRRARRRLHRLRDVGHAELGYAEVRSYAYSEGKPILGFAVSRQIGSNVIQIKRDMLAKVAELNETC